VVLPLPMLKIDSAANIKLAVANVACDVCLHCEMCVCYVYTQHTTHRVRGCRRHQRKMPREGHKTQNL
jgi:hypothetical protein